MENIIEITNYTKKLKNNIVLDNINLNVNKGTILWLKGKNGSGKTMLLRAMCGLILPDDGAVWVNGSRLNHKKRFPDNTGILIENTNFWRNYTAFETLKIIAEINHKIDDEAIKETLDRIGLDPYDKKKVGKFSLGMKQKLAISQAIMEKPDLLLLDEPTNALDQESVGLVQRIIQEESARGATIVIASHIEEDIRILYHEVALIDCGKLLWVKEKMVWNNGIYGI